MKKIIYILLIITNFFNANAQQNVQLDDFGRIVLNTYLSENANLPSEAKKALETKLNQITTNNGMGVSSDVLK